MSGSSPAPAQRRRCVGGWVGVRASLTSPAPGPAGRAARAPLGDRGIGTSECAPRSPLVAEVLVVPARRRTPLALVLRALLGAAVRVLGGRRHLEEGDLADLHPRVERDRQV